MNPVSVTFICTFPQALALKLALEDAYKAAGAALAAFPKGPMGLTPDSVKDSPEWRAAYRESLNAHNTLRDFNEWFRATYSKEYRDWRDAQRAQALQRQTELSDALAALKASAQG